MMHHDRSLAPTRGSAYTTGRAGIRGGCSTYFSLYDLHQARIALDAAQREFVRRAGPWARQREPRQRKAADATEEPPLHP